jgi:bifunctional protein TilS/HprT
VSTSLNRTSGQVPVASVLPSERTEFVHNSERQLAQLLDFYGIEWAYEPHTFVLSRGPDGQVTEAFSPDFFLPAHQRYLEVTTLRQALVTRKNRKVRRLRELHPEIDISIIYQRDYLHLLARYGLESPSQHEPAIGTRASEVDIGLLELGPVGPSHPSNPAFRRAS